MIIPKKTKLAVFAGAATLAALAPQARAQSADGLIDKLVEKGILTVKEAQDLREESDQDFKTAFQAKTGMPDWVTGYKFSGDFRGRYEQYTTPNAGGAFVNGGLSGMDHIRLRYRLRFGFTVNMEDNLEAGFRIGSGDPKGANGGGTPLSNSSTFQQNFDKKPVYIDTAYGKWTPINAGSWMLSATIGKMDNPFQFTPMVFDQDLTPEGATVQAGYTINDHHSLSATAAAFVLNDSYNPVYNSGGTTEAPFLYGGQMVWNAKWSPKWSSSLGAGAFELVNDQSLGLTNAAAIPLTNLGNTRNDGGQLQYNYLPVIADASVTYLCETFPFYNGAFPITIAGEGMNNPGAPANNNGYWGGITFGKSGTKHTWDLSYRYEYLESDAWYDQLVDDDNVAFYPYAPGYNGQLSAFGTVSTPLGYVGGTNVKGHLIKFNYSATDSLTFSIMCYVNSLIVNSASPATSPFGEPHSNALHFMADAAWKF